MDSGQLSVCIGTLAAFAAVVFYYANAFQDDKKWQREIEYYRGRVLDRDAKRWEKYRAGLSRWLKAIERFYGFDTTEKDNYRPGPLGRCLQLAFAYPLIFLCTASLLAPDGGISGLPLFPPSGEWERAIFILYIMGISLVFYLTVSNGWTFKFISLIARKVGLDRSRYPSLVFDTAEILISTCILISFGWVASFGATFIIGISENTYAIIMVAILAALAASGGPIAFIAFCVAAAITYDQTNVFMMTWLIAFLILPLLNGHLDWASLWITRKLILRWASDSNHSPPTAILWRYIGGSMLDAFFAFICIIILAAMMGSSGAVLEWLIAAYPSPNMPEGFRWMDTMDAFRNEPFGSGIAITLMLLTTLLPTLFHLTAGLGAVTLIYFSGRKRILRKLASGPLAGTEAMWLAAEVVLRGFILPVVVWGSIIFLFTRFVLTSDMVNGVWAILSEGDQPLMDPEIGMFFLYYPYQAAAWGHQLATGLLGL